MELEIIIYSALIYIISLYGLTTWIKYTEIINELKGK